MVFKQSTPQPPSVMQYSPNYFQWSPIIRKGVRFTAEILHRYIDMSCSSHCGVFHSYLLSPGVLSYQAVLMRDHSVRAEEFSPSVALGGCSSCLASSASTIRGGATVYEIPGGERGGETDAGPALKLYTAGPVDVPALLLSHKHLAR